MIEKLLLLLAGEGQEAPIVPASGWATWLILLAAFALSFVAVLTLCIGVGAMRLSDDWREQLTATATLRIAGPIASQDSRMEKAAELLRNAPGISRVRVLDDAEHAALLAPWLGDAAGLQALPAPRLADVALVKRGADLQGLQAKLDAEVIGATLDTHGAWRRPILQAASGIERLAWIATGLVVLAATAAVALSVRASLSGHAEVIRIVRLIGGEDRYIVSAFVLGLAMRAAAGAFGGAALGMIAVGLLPSPLPDAEGSARLGLTFPELALLVVGVTVAVAAIAAVTARLSVAITLRQMP